MATALTGDPSTFPTQTAPVAGEPRTAASVATPFQNAANRAEYLRDRLQFVDPDKSGVRRLRRFGSIADLQASIDFPDGSFAYVDGLGLYQFSAASEALNRSPFVVTPASVGGGAGRWLLEAFGALNVPFGLPQLDVDGKIPGTVLSICDVATGRVLGESIVNGRTQLSTRYIAGSFTVPQDSTFRAVVGAVNMTLVAGQVALINYSTRVLPQFGDSIQLRVLVTAPDSSPHLLSDSLQVVEATSNSGVNGIRSVIQLHFVATLDGTHTFDLQASGLGGNLSTIDVDRTWSRIEVVRP